jgi:hypothetical protein
MRVQNDSLPPDARVASYAGQQHGRIAVWQLRLCGLDDSAVARRVRSGRLHRIHRGVYAVGHAAETLEGTFMAAVLACGPGSVLSHFSAAGHHGLAPWQAGRLPEVTVRDSHTRQLERIVVHRSRTLDRVDVWSRDGIEVTSPARTALDVAATTRTPDLRRMVRQGYVDKLLNIRVLLDLLSRAGKHPGAPALRAIVTEGHVPTRSVFEDLLLDLIATAGIDSPDVNPTLYLDGRPIEPDFLWRHLRLVIEADSRTWHDDPLTRQNDAEKQAILEAHGYRVLRITWEQAVQHPQQTIARIRQAIAAAERRAA